jgi:predicted transcriptional regulator
MSLPGMSATGYDTVGDIVATHMLRYHTHADASSVALDILSNHIPVAPVVNDEGHLAGIIGEVEILDALRKGQDIRQLKAEDLMKEDLNCTVTEKTPISEVVNRFQEEELQIIPVVRDGQVIESVTRHDLIRAMTGAGLGFEK